LLAAILFSQVAAAPECPTTKVMPVLTIATTTSAALTPFFKSEFADLNIEDFRSIRYQARYKSAKRRIILDSSSPFWAWLPGEPTRLESASPEFSAISPEIAAALTKNRSNVEYVFLNLGMKIKRMAPIALSGTKTATA
jgi:hypothetical protein